METISAFSFSEIRAVDDYIDAEGRPLGEHRARCLMPTTAMELKTCPYRGSRHHHELPMNASALKQVSSHWADAIGLMVGFHQLFEERYGHRPAGTIEQLQLASAITAIPAWLKNRVDSPVAACELTASISSAYKITIGFRRLLQVLASGELLLGETEDPTRLSVDELYEFADRGGFLVGAVQVCAGSKHQIEQATQALLFGQAISQPNVGHLRELLVDVDRFFDFAESIFRIECLEAAVQTSAVVSLRTLTTSSLDNSGQPDESGARTDPVGLVPTMIARVFAAIALQRHRATVAKRPQAAKAVTSIAWLAVLAGRLIGFRIPKLDSHLNDAAAAIDGTGTVTHFIDTRHPDQIGDLVIGWCRLARVEGVDSSVARYRGALATGHNRDASWPRTVSEQQLAAHHGLIDLLQPVFEREQRALNAALGRLQGTGEHLSALLPVSVPARASLLPAPAMR